MPLWSPQISQSPLPTLIPPSLPRTFSANLLCPPPSKFPNTFYAQPLKLSDYFPRTFQNPYPSTFQNPHPITVLAHLTTTQTLTPELSKNFPRTFQELSQEISKNFPRTFPAHSQALNPILSNPFLFSIMPIPILSSTILGVFNNFFFILLAFHYPLKIIQFMPSFMESVSLHGVFMDPPPHPIF